MTAAPVSPRPIPACRVGGRCTAPSLRPPRGLPAGEASRIHRGPGRPAVTPAARAGPPLTTSQHHHDGRAAPVVVDLPHPQAFGHRPSLDDQQPRQKCPAEPGPQGANVTCYGTSRPHSRNREFPGQTNATSFGAVQPVNARAAAGVNVQRRSAQREDERRRGPQGPGRSLAGPGKGWSLWAPGWPWALTWAGYRIMITGCGSGSVRLTSERATAAVPGSPVPAAWPT